MKTKELSIFFPFWNEEKNVEKVITDAVITAKNVADKWEIIAVDDGSSDDTLSIAKGLVRTYKNLRVVSHWPNRGYGAALKEGFVHSRYNIIVFADGDGQFDISEISRFLEKIDNADIVIGYRRKRHDHPFRHMLMNLLKIWDLLFFGFYFRDIDCGFKMFKKSAIAKIMPLESEGAMITTEILAKAKKARLTIDETEVSHYARKYGDQSGGNLRVIVRAIKETFIVWKGIRNGRN